MDSPSAPPAASTPPVPGSVADAQSASSLSTPAPAPAARGRPRGALTGTGAKRGRKPRGGATGVGTTTPRMPSQENTNTSSTSPAIPAPQFTHVHWNLPAQTQTQAGTSGTPTASATVSGSTTATTPGTVTTPATYSVSQTAPQMQRTQTAPASYTIGTSATSSTTPATPVSYVVPSGSTPAASAALSSLGISGLLNLSSTSTPVLPVGAGTSTNIPTTALTLARTSGVADDENDGDDDMLPAMADDDYSAQLSWQSQSKDNLKVLMDNFSPEQYERFEAYRRHALPKQAVRKVIQQTLGQQVSQPVAQIIAGFAKVFVGEIVEKAREVQARRNETGPLSPDHLREAYRIYQAETGRVGAARPLRAKRLFYR